MPISIQITRGLLTPAGERQIVPRISQALLESHGLQNNAFMKAATIGHLVVADEATAYVGGESQSLAVVEVKVPALAFRDRAVQQRFVAEATSLIDELKAGSHPPNRTFVNVTYAVDGTWGIAGRAYTNEDLGSAIADAFAQ